MKMNLKLSIFAFLALAILASGCAQSKSYGVNIEDDGLLFAHRFDPDEITIRPGDTVVWTNSDDDPHTQ